jgi:hypothetical protein
VGEKGLKDLFINVNIYLVLIIFILGTLMEMSVRMSGASLLRKCGQIFVFSILLCYFG